MKLVSVRVLLLVLFSLVAAPAAWSAVVIQISEVGGDLVVDGSGTVDLSDCTYFSTTANGGILNPDVAVVVGPSGASVDVYDCLFWSGPTSIGPAAVFFADSGAGDAFGPRFDLARLGVPPGYSSGNPLSGSSVYTGESFASVGLTPDTSYLWTWNDFPTRDKLIVNVGNATPPGPVWAGPDLNVSQSNNAVVQEEDVILAGVASLARGRTGPFCNLQGGDSCVSSNTNPSDLQFAFSGFNGNPIFAYGAAASQTSLTFRNFKTSLEGMISGNLPPP